MSPCWFCWTSQQLSVPSTILSSWAFSLGWDSEALFYGGSSPSWRTEKVVLGGFCLMPCSSACDVPQGSCLSPILFNIYMIYFTSASTGRCCPERWGLMSQYVDDTQFYLSWKKKLLLDGVKTFLKTKVCSLDVLLGSSLSLDTQVSGMARSAFAQ